MLHSYADNAIMAKVKAMYGKRLTSSDYEQLVQKKTVGEVAGYLARETGYADNLREVKEDLIHREQLENLVRRRTLDTYNKLLKYSRGDRLFLSMYVMEHEIEQLLTVIRLLNSGHTNRYIVSLPVYLAKLMSFDLFELAKINVYDDLLRILERSEYYRIAGRFRPTAAGKIVDITSLEAALLAHYYDKTLGIIREDYRGQTRKDLETMMKFRISFHNCQVIYRMRRYLGATTELIRPRIVHVDGGPNEKIYEDLLNAPDLDAMCRTINRMHVVNRRPFDWAGSAAQTGNHMLRIRGELHRKLFRTSTKPPVVAASYMTLLEIEIRNIIHIIEGIRYGVQPAEIRKWLAV